MSSIPGPRAMAESVAQRVEIDPAQLDLFPDYDRREQLALETASYHRVADILPQINDEAGILEDGRFEREMQDFFDLIDNERAASGFDVMDNDKRTILVHEYYRTALKFKDKRRKGLIDGQELPEGMDKVDEDGNQGDLVFYDHLLGAAKILVSVMGITGISTLLSIIKHDWVEDFTEKSLEGRERADRERELYDELLDVQQYYERIKNFSPEIAETITGIVKQQVKGMTKVKKATKGKSFLATFKLLLSIVVDEVRAFFAKTADRLHNLSTLEAHGDDDKSKRTISQKLRESEEFFLPTLRILGVRDAVRDMVYHIARFENPELQADFDTLQGERRTKKLAPYKAAISEIIARSAGSNVIKEVKFVPKNLSDYLENGKTIEGLRLDDLDIGPSDPMFEVVVILKDQVMEHASAEAFLRIVSEAIAQEFKKDADNTSVESEKLDYGQGVLLKCFNRNLGGIIPVRVNYSKSDSRVKRGVLYNFFGHGTPERSAKILEHIRRTTISGFEDALNEVFKPEVSAFTPQGKEIRLPKGATVLDFAASIHSDLIGGLESARVWDGLHDTGRGKDVDILSPIEEGKVYKVVSVISSVEDGPLRDTQLAKIKSTPMWYLIMQDSKKDNLRGFMKSLSPDLQVYIGANYLQEIASVFAIPINELMYLVQDRHAKRYELALMKYLSSGRFSETLKRFLLEKGYLSEDKSLKRYRRDEIVEAIVALMKTGDVLGYGENTELVDELVDALNNRNNNWFNADNLHLVKVALRDKLEYQEEMLQRICVGRINPLQILADYHVKRIKQIEKFKARSEPLVQEIMQQAGDADLSVPVPKLLDERDLNFWTFAFDLKDERGELKHFASVIQDQNGLFVEKIEKHVLDVEDGGGERVDRLIVTFDVERSAGDVYDFMRKIVRASHAFRVDGQEDFISRYR